MNRTRAFLCALLVVLSAVAVGPAAAQEDLVTLTVSVETSAGEAVGDATLTAAWDGGSRSRTTASNGRAFLDVPAGAEVEIHVQHSDYVRNFPVTVSDASERELDVTVYRRSTARVLVEDGDGPVPGAEVSLRKEGREVHSESTEDDGIVDSGTIEAGTYSVVVSEPGYYVVEETLEVDGDTETSVRIRRGTVTLEVNVTDDHFDSPRPVGEATVDVAGSGSVTTQPTGIGRISVPVNAWAQLDVTKDGYRTTEVSEFIAEDDEEVEVSIERVPSISVETLSSRVVTGENASITVTDEYGEPVEAATVRINGEEVAETDGSGEAVFQVGSAGNHTVTAESGSLEATTYVRGVSEDEATGDGDPETDPSDDGTETAAETPGFGVGAALVALAVVLAGVLRRRART